MEPPADDPDRVPPSLPHATLWQRESDLFAVHAVLRLRPDGDAYVIERSEVAGDRSWQPVLRIGRTYEVPDGESDSAP